ncbi:MAG: hypothetical protein HYX83_03120 [Chloroflexi bacterium]|nr:hypothetical protein [Chloroflexota bacterium]
MMRVGIPRALLYYQYSPMWQVFFKEFGAEVVVSPPTTPAMLAEGSSRVVADTCLPAKVFLGHVLYLADKCDYIFIPAIRSTRKNVHNCSKFLGLPDMTRAVIPEAPPILEIDIDVNRGKRRLYQAIYRLGRHFTWSPLRVRRVALTAWQAHRHHREMLAGQNLRLSQMLENQAGGATALSASSAAQTTIALIGHPYLLYDEYVNHRLIYRLEQANVRVVTPEMLTIEELESATNRLAGRAYWTYEEEIVGAGGHYLQNEADGVIGIMAFGCGPDSLMMEMVHRQAARLKSVPFMPLTVEEHTAEAGIVTRLEAFVDMIRLRKRRAQ